MDTSQVLPADTPKGGHCAHTRMNADQLQLLTALLHGRPPPDTRSPAPGGRSRRPCGAYAEGLLPGESAYASAKPTGTCGPVRRVRRAPQRHERPALGHRLGPEVASGGGALASGSSTGTTQQLWPQEGPRQASRSGEPVAGSTGVPQCPSSRLPAGLRSGGRRRTQRSALPPYRTGSTQRSHSPPPERGLCHHARAIWEGGKAGARSTAARTAVEPAVPAVRPPPVEVPRGGPVGRHGPVRQPPALAAHGTLRLPPGTTAVTGVGARG
jgi:hypothetical protein